MIILCYIQFLIGLLFFNNKNDMVPSVITPSNNLRNAKHNPHWNRLDKRKLYLSLSLRNLTYYDTQMQIIQKSKKHLSVRQIMSVPLLYFNFKQNNTFWIQPNFKINTITHTQHKSVNVIHMQAIELHCQQPSSWLVACQVSLEGRVQRWFLKLHQLYTFTFREKSSD